MKKAKEYSKEIIDKYIETDATTAINTTGVEIIQGLCKEYEELKVKRNLVKSDGISYNGMLNLLKELHIKWVAICRHTNKEVVLLDEMGWLNFVEDKMPGLFPNLLTILK